MEAKIEMRRAIKERLTRLSANDRRVESQVIVRELRKLIAGNARVIAAYSPYLDEPDISPLVSELLKEKNVICMGKNEGNHMAMHQVSSLEHVHRNPNTGILEPTEHSPVDEGSIEVAIIPGRAFTSTGNRMGRGNGGYDRWIREQRERNPQTLMIGVCFECQVFSEIPMEPHDERVDILCTANHIFHCMKA